MNNAVSSLNDIAREWEKAGSIPEVDWNRVRALEFQEVLRKRNELAQGLKGKACLLCGNFKDHVCSINRAKCYFGNSLESNSTLSYMAK